MQPTPYEDINSLLDTYTKNLVGLLGDNLLGFYLTGSLSYGDFTPGRSDIDLVAVVKEPVPPDILQMIREMHFQIEASHEKWKNQIECSYTPLDMYKNILPPKEPRPYFGKGIFWADAIYGNEWIINNYMLYQHGIALFGPEFKTLVAPIDIKDVREASARDLFQEWEPKITDPVYLDNSHYQSYVVLNLCRILYTVLHGATGSKKVSAAWVKQEFPQWRELIETAEAWRHGMEMKRKEETVGFIRFAMEKVGPVKENCR